MPTQTLRMAPNPWRNVLPAGAPGCSQGTPYSFWNGVRFLDWFTAAMTGQSVDDVACVDCETPEHYWTRPASL